MSEPLEALIAKLEAATEGSRELDELIWLALGNRIHTITEIGGGYVHKRWIDAQDTRWKQDGTRFTTSLDAALMLVPAGLSAGMQTRPPAASIFDANGNVISLPWADGKANHVIAATPALALCIAALKARVKGRANHWRRDDERLNRKAMDCAWGQMGQGAVP